MRSAPILAALAFLLCAVLTPQARADGLFSVGGVKVDVTAASAADARAAGFAQAQALAFSRLVKRVTLPAELAAKGPPPLAGAALDPLVASVDIEQERPAGAHYVAQLRVSFDPAATRAALQAQGLRVLETRGPPILVVPQAQGVQPGLADQWTAAWQNGGYDGELTPLSIAPDMMSGPPDWGQAAPAAAAAGASLALYASLRLAGPNAYADLTEVGPNGIRRAFGAVSAPVSPGAEAAAFQALTQAANDLVQNEWKQSAPTIGGQRERMVASAIYSSQAEWRRLQRGLEGAAKSVVSGVSIDAVSKAAAMVSFSYVGGRDQLAAALRRNGVVLEDSPQGALLKLAPGGA